MNMFLKTGERVAGSMDCASTIVQLGDFFYLSGQNGWGETFQEQCIHACMDLADVLKEFNLRFDHILKFTVYLTDIELKDEFLRTFMNFIDQPAPALTIVEVSRLENNAMVCLEGCGVNTLRHERSMSEAYCEDCDQ